MKINIYTDGGSRGNPGPAAIGVVIELEVEIKEYSQYLGRATNNEAEYQAVIFALKKIKLLVGKSKAKKSDVAVFVDSELLAKQLNGEYKIKDKEIQELFIQLWNLKIDFGEISFKNVPRAKNERADKLVNQELDKQTTGKLKL